MTTLLAATSPLVVMRGDSYVRPIIRRVRFAIAHECLTSEAHLEVAVGEAVKAATHDLRREGFEYDPSFLTMSPLEAVKATVRNFLRESAETGRRAYGDEMEDSTAQVLPHIARALDFTPDPGYVRPPPPPRNPTAEQMRNYKRVADQYSAIERRAVAKDMPALRDMVDIRVRLTFREHVQGKLAAVPSSLRGQR